MESELPIQDLRHILTAPNDRWRLLLSSLIRQQTEEDALKIINFLESHLSSAGKGYLLRMRGMIEMINVFYSNNLEGSFIHNPEEQAIWALACELESLDKKKIEIGNRIKTISLMLSEKIGENKQWKLRQLEVQIIPQFNLQINNREMVPENYWIKKVNETEIINDYIKYEKIVPGVQITNRSPMVNVKIIADSLNLEKV